MRKQRIHDAVIIGAGPSGLNTARRLSSRGLDVIVLEKKSEIGNNVVCTGIVGDDIFSRFQLSSESSISRIQEVDLYSPRNMKLAYRHPVPFAHILNRNRFDAELSWEAEKQGAILMTDCDVKSIQIKAGKAEIFAAASGREKVFYGRILVLATGNNFRLHKHLELGQPREFLNAVQIELNTGYAERTEIWVGKKVAPGGFAWSVPVAPNRVRSGLLTKMPPVSFLKSFIQNRCPEAAENFDSLVMRRKTIAQGVVSPTYGHRVIAVGEAAGQVKTTTGGGIFYGLLCSEIAADVIMNNSDSDRFTAKDLSAYEKLWKEAIQKELTVGYYTRKICSCLNDQEVEKLFEIARDDGVFPLIKEMAHFDWQKDIILTLAKKATVRSLRVLPQLFS